MKTLRRIVRLIIISTSAILGVAAIMVLFVVIYFAKPYIQVTEARSSTEPKTVKVRWYVSCEKEYYVDDKEQFYDPQIPVGGVYPGVGSYKVMFSDTEFVLIGYPYNEIRRNYFTNVVNVQRSERFDVIEWHIVTPYRTIEGEEEIESNKPLQWKSDNTSPLYFSELYRGRKGGC